MRIIGEFDIDNIKVTVFKMNERISVKFEYNLLEQTYKFRDGCGLNNMDDVKKYCNNDVMCSIKDIFIKMSESRSSGLVSFSKVSEDEFDHII